MTRTALTVLTALVASSVALTASVCADEGLSSADPSTTLRRVTSQTLLSVPDDVVYESSWSDSVVTQPVVQMSHRTTPEDTPVAAAATPFWDPTQPDEVASPSLTGSSSSETNALFSRLAIWTVIILCLCVLTVLGLRRWQRRQGLLPSGRGQARIIETLALGPGRAVSLVQLGPHQAFVGTDSGGISTIVLAPPAFEDALDALEKPSVPSNTSHRVVEEDVTRTLGFPATFLT